MPHGDDPPSTTTILVVEDVKEVQAMLVACLESAGYKAIGVGDARSMRAAMLERRFDLVLLDLRLPDADGMALLKALRADSNIGIIIVSSYGAPHERARGLEAGADDYLAKPVYPRELVARVRNVLERRHGTRVEAAPAQTIRIGSWTLDRQNRNLLDDQGCSADLTRAEFDLLCLLAERPGRIMTREMLASLMGGGSGSADHLRKIDVLVSRIRKKLAPGAEGTIETCRGYGYRFTCRS